MPVLVMLVLVMPVLVKSGQVKGGLVTRVDHLAMVRGGVTEGLVMWGLVKGEMVGHFS